MSLFKVLFGATTGLAAGLVLAKKSGKEFRKDLEGKSNEEKTKIFGKEILSIGKDLVEELKNLSETEQVEKLKTLGKEKLEFLTDEIKNRGVKKISQAKEIGKNKLDELVPKLEKTIDKIKKTGSEKIDEKISDAKKFSGKKINDVKKNFKKEETVGVKMSKIFKK